MTGYLLDTNVVSEVIRPRPSPSVLAFFKDSTIEELFISDVVIAEIRFGIEKAAGNSRRGQLTTWLENIIRPMCAGRILSLTENTLFRWRLMLDECRIQGRTVAEPDLMLAATAAEHDLIIVTRDVTPFNRMNLAVFNPWTHRS